MNFTNDDLDQCIAELGMLKFFPTDQSTKGAIKSYLAKICPHREALVWLVRTLVNNVGEWVGSADVRRLLAQRYRPADGDEGLAPAAEPDFINWDNFPGHRDERTLPPSERKQLSAAEAAELSALPDRPAGEILGDVIQHFEKPWPRPALKFSGEIRKLEEQLARDMAAAIPLSEAQLKSRLLELEAALGKSAAGLPGEPPPDPGGLAGS